MKIHIIGAGISGLCIAHILSTRYSKLEINVYDKLSYIGGKVGMIRPSENLLEEHSPRIFQGQYMNLYKFLKEIPDEDGKPCYDKLTKPLDSYIVNRDCSVTGLAITDILPKLGFWDLIKMSYYMMYGLFSSTLRLRDEFDKISFGDTLTSRKSYDLFEYISYALGENMKILPMYKVYKTFEYDFKSWVGEYPGIAPGGRRFTQSLDKSIFENWKNFLEKRGVKIHLEHDLLDVKKDDNKITSLIFNSPNSYVNKDAKDGKVIFALNVEALSSLYDILDIDKKHKIRILNNATSNWQPGLQIYFKNKLTMKRFGSFMLDTDWKMIIQPLDNFYTDPASDIENKNVKSLWSINIANTKLYSKKLRKRVIDCTEEEIKDEVLWQIRTSCINDYIEENIDEVEVYRVSLWKGDNAFWNRMDTLKLRPGVKTPIDNLYLSGAILDTNYYSYFQEGAAEAAYMTVNEMLKDEQGEEISYYKHERPILFQPFQKIDEILYMLGLPSFFLVLIAVAIFINFILKVKYG